MRKLLYLLIVLAGIIFFYHHAVLYPLKLLLVFFHESSHALAALMTGGEVEKLIIRAEQSGLAYTRGGSRFLTLTAGYLGTLIWGMVIYLIAVKTRYDKQAMAVLGFLVAGISLIYARNVFGFWFGLGTGIVLIGLGLKATEEVNDFILRVIGLTSMVDVPLRIYDIAIERPGLHSDASMLADEFGGTTLMWGGLWLVISVLMIFYCLRWSLAGVSDDLGNHHE